MNLVVREAEHQAALLPAVQGELTVAIGSLALGGAERIVLDWAQRVQPRWKVHLIVLRDDPNEWPTPTGARLTRLHGRDLPSALRRLGSNLATSPHPVCLCHLLTRAERLALAAGGAIPIPVLHNARSGWLEEASSLRGAPLVITVSRSSAAELRRAGWRGAISVLHHLPAARRASPEERVLFRHAWNVPEQATVVGMIGGVKPQKNYPAALRALAALPADHDAYLVIVGGPTGRNGKPAWQELLAEIERLGVRHRVALPGPLVDAARCLSAFDVFLNTSHYEGLSIATLEALAAGLPVVASAVGGQGEIDHPALTLLDSNSPPMAWARAIAASRSRLTDPEPWPSFPSYRLWTLATLARPVPRGEGVLFVTANLNAGGAQRSLVNLLRGLRGTIPTETLVTGRSTTSAFVEELEEAACAFYRTAEGRDPFAHAEAIVARVAKGGVGTLCFWNVDPKIKLLCVKALAFSPLRFVDVSPGPSSFAELAACAPFQRRICFDEREYSARLDRLVLKYEGPYPAATHGKVTVIPNGVACRPAAHRRESPASIVVSGRLAPSKYVLETIAAMPFVWSKVSEATLHIVGAAEPRHEDYAELVQAAAGGEAGRRIVFHGQCFDPAFLAGHAVCVVLGQDQGCPNTVLEALAAGVPVIANDDGGTRDLVHHRETGLLLSDRRPETLAAALVEVLSNPERAREWGANGRQLVTRSYSIQRMTRRYQRILGMGRGPLGFISQFFLPLLRVRRETQSWSVQGATERLESSIDFSVFAGPRPAHAAVGDSSTPPRLERAATTSILASGRPPAQRT